MLDAILGRLIPHYGQPDDPEARKGCGLLAGGVGLGLNLLLFAVKLCAGLLTGAISVTADAFNNLSDAAGSAVTLAGFKLAAQRADERHPFGHGRIEYLAGLAASHFFHVQLDGWLGLLVAALILRTGWEAARDTLDPLLGTPPDPAMVADIEKLVLGHPQILGLHDLVVHDYGPGRRMMSVHAEVPADGSLVELHDVIDRAERELKERFGLEAVIHLDPVDAGDPCSDRLRALAEGLAREIDPAATIHDFRRGGEGEVSFDVVVPYDVALSDRQVREALAEKLARREPDCRPSIGVDRSHVL